MFRRRNMPRPPGGSLCGLSKQRNRAPELQCTSEGVGSAGFAVLTGKIGHSGLMDERNSNDKSRARRGWGLLQGRGTCPRLKGADKVARANRKAHGA